MLSSNFTLFTNPPSCLQYCLTISWGDWMSLMLVDILFFVIASGVNIKTQQLIKFERKKETDKVRWMSHFLYGDKLQEVNEVDSDNWRVFFSTLNRQLCKIFDYVFCIRFLFIYDLFVCLHGQQPCYCWSCSCKL